jgi:hypothetical protein
MRAAPIAAERIPKSDRNGAAAAAAAIPLRRNPILPIIVSIAIIVTPRGLSFVVFFMCHFRSNLAPLFRI